MVGRTWREWIDAEGLCEGTFTRPHAPADSETFKCRHCGREFKRALMARSGRDLYMYIPKHRPLRG